MTLFVKDFDAETTGFNSDAMKQKTPYLAVIVGAGTRYKLERSFVKKSLTDEGYLKLPDRNGVYEVRDYPDAQPRTRYLQVLDGAARMLDPLNDDDVLAAVDASARRLWAEAVKSDASMARDLAQANVADTIDVLETIDQVEKDLVASFNGEFGLDEEDVRMALDKIRRVVEKL